MSQLKIKNGNNWESIPAGGIGVPSGGTTGQFLKKSSSVDYATEWDGISAEQTATFSQSSASSKNATLVAVWRTFGNVVQMSLSVTPTATIDPGTGATNRVYATLPSSVPKPIANITFISLNLRVAEIQTDGTVIYQVLNVSQLANNTQTVTGTYLTA